MSFASKLRSVVLNVSAILVILGGIFSLWAFGISQVSNIAANSRATLERQATDACMVYEIPQAVVFDGEIYCFFVYAGTGQIITIENLEKYYKEHNIKPPRSKGG